ncbi:sarcosine oxidase subunit gamma [Roseivivax sediminis]|uniref:Sarcosine oxidase subunit gamma n=1 Tax=Roseivivax sediminis TaxID=936889 RepID=A0A1I2DLD3_9RHOB|nr:sarcosine oxidase subunit gamma family protein [Roseivivax sediminis]SFE80730.1 sarcosine oxidase subunit gamma [Roseivivax sediminis]
MFDATPPLARARQDGRVSVECAGLTGMVTLRGDIAAIGEPVADATGLSIPDTLGIVEDGGRALAWMSPDELMLFCAYDEAEEIAATLTAATAEDHALVANVSDARAMFELSGEEAALRETLAKLTPADLRPDAFPPGTIRRTRLAQVSGAIWLAEDGAMRVICFRSVADYVFSLLCHAARPAAAVGHF